MSSSSASVIARSTSETATGCTELRIHTGTGCPTKRVEIWRMISNDVEPAPITIAARSTVAGTDAARNTPSTSRRERR